jgi:hypothetical protein
LGTWHTKQEARISSSPSVLFAVQGDYILRRHFVPPGKGRNCGCGFINFSWPRDAPINPTDICTNLYGFIKVHSRAIYLCSTENANNSPSNDTNVNSESLEFSDRSLRSEPEHDTSNASQDASDYSESQHDTSTASTAASDYLEPYYEM